MKEIKAFIRTTRLNLILETLKKAGFYNVTFNVCEGTGAYQNEKASPSLRFHITDSELVKLELVCGANDVDTIIQIIIHFTNDLGADSLDFVELTVEFEKAFKISIVDEDAEHLLTIGDAEKYLRNKLNYE